MLARILVLSMLGGGYVPHVPATCHRLRWGHLALCSRHNHTLRVVARVSMEGYLYGDGAVVLSFATPIFHFGERKHAVSAARSDYLRSVVAKDDVRDRVTLDESNGWTNLTLSYRRMLTADESLAIARENLEISTYSYTEGLTTILDVLQAQLSWLQIYTNAITAQYDYAVAVAAYEYITCRQLEVSN